MPIRTSLKHPGKLSIATPSSTTTLRAAVVEKSTLQGRVIPKFPVNVVGVGGITITKENGVYTFSLDDEGLDQIDAAVIISDSPPLNPSVGTLWFDSNSGKTFIWYEDIDGAQWIQQATIGSQGPPGEQGEQGSVGPAGPPGTTHWDDLTDKPATFPPTLPIAQSGVTNLVTDLAAKQDISAKGAASGYASLDSGGKVPAAQLPAYVDDVVEYANLAAFPGTGVAGVIYVAQDTGKIYRWSGSAYVEISPSAGGASPSDLTPVMDGTAIPGVSALYARGDHVHPTDTTRQPLDTELTALAGLASAADRLPYFTGSGTASLTVLTNQARLFLDDVDASAQRGTLGLTNAAIATPSALTKADDTNVTLTLGGTPTTALLAATSITAGWTGTLSIARGGNATTTGISAAAQTALDGKAATSHTHTAANVTDFSEAVDDRVNALLVAGTNITKTYDDVANTLTLDATGGSGGGIAEAPTDGQLYSRQGSTGSWQVSPSGGGITVSPYLTNPTTNGELVIEATTDTHLTFKYQGSDGVIRIYEMPLVVDASARIDLSASEVLEDALGGTIIGLLSTVNTTGTPVYAIVADPDDKFMIVDNELRSKFAFDYETQTTHSVTVGVSGVTPDALDRTYVVEVLDTEEPEPSIELSSATVSEDAVIATVVGLLSVAYATGTPVFAIVADPDSKFTIVGYELRLNATVDYEAKTAHSVTIGVTGVTPAVVDHVFSIGVADADDGSDFAVYDPSDMSEAPVTSIVIDDAGYSNGVTFAANTISPSHGFNPAGSCFTSTTRTSPSTSYKYLQATDFDNFLFRSKYYSRDHSWTGFIINGEVFLRYVGGKAWSFRINIVTNSLTISLMEGLTENTHSPIGNSADATYSVYNTTSLHLLLSHANAFPGWVNTDTDGNLMRCSCSGLDLVFEYSINGTDFEEIVRCSPTKSYVNQIPTANTYSTWLHMAPGAVAIAHITTYGHREWRIDYDDTPSTLLSDFTTTLHMADLGVKKIATTGTMSASSTSLTVASAVGFAIGDYIIVDTVGASGAAALGSVGPGGVWPALRYADAAAMTADTSQAANTLCSLTSTGYTYQYVSGVWQQLLTYSSGNRYIHKSLPLALRARITNIAGSVLTLDTASHASGAVTSSGVYFDCEPIIQANTANTAYGVTIPALELVFADGDIVIGEPITIYGKAGWSYRGAGSGIANSAPTGLTRWWAPKGCPSASLKISNNCIEAKDMFFDCGAYIAFPQLGTHVMTQISTSVDYPYGFSLLRCDDSIVDNIRTKQMWQKAVGLSDCSGARVSNCVCEMSDALTRYVQWMFQSSGSEAWGAGNRYIDCEMNADWLTTFCEPFLDDGTQYIRCVARNGYSSNNSSINTVYTDLRVVVEANSRYSVGSMAVTQPMAQTNGNMRPGVPSVVNWTRFGYLLEGYVDAANEQPQGIIISSGDGSVVADAMIQMLPYSVTSTQNGAVGINANSDATITGCRVDGTTMDIYKGNIWAYGASNLVTVTGNIADRVVTTGTDPASVVNTNSTPAVAGTDRTPTALSFTAVTDAVAGQTYTSNVVTIAGVNAFLTNVALTSNAKFIWTGGSGGTHPPVGAGRVRNNNHFLLKLLRNGDQIALQATASMTPSATVTVTFTVASGVSYNWTITTAAPAGVTWVMDDGTWDDAKTWQDTGIWMD